MAMAEKFKDPKTPHKAGERRERGGWLAKVAPGVRKALSKRDTPENLWVKCPDTGEMIYRPDLEAALWVTPAGRHMRIGSELRFRYTFDDGKWESIPTPPVPEDPLEFFDGHPKHKHQQTTHKTTHTPNTKTNKNGSIKGVPAVVLVQDF